MYFAKHPHFIDFEEPLRPLYEEILRQTELLKQQAGKSAGSGIPAGGTGKGPGKAVSDPGMPQAAAFSTELPVVNHGVPTADQPIVPDPGMAPSVIQALERQFFETAGKLSADLSPWQRVLLSRHPNRPYMKTYLKHICSNFTEIFGDRRQADDKAMIGGFAEFNGQTVMMIGQQKGYDAHTRTYRNFGMAKPAGYRKALRLMQLAEKFNKPIIALIDTPGAYPGIEGEEFGVGEAIARNIYEMLRLKVPFISVIIGEGGSGGAFGVAVGDRTLMMENTWYSVISPESCSAILWHDTKHKETAAMQLQLTAVEMLQNKLVHGIVPEPPGGAHWDYLRAAENLKQALIRELEPLLQMDPTERINQRMKMYASFGFWEEEDPGAA